MVSAMAKASVSVRVMVRMGFQLVGQEKMGGVVGPLGAGVGRIVAIENKKPTTTMWQKRKKKLKLKKLEVVRAEPAATTVVA